MLSAWGRGGHSAPLHCVQTGGERHGSGKMQLEAHHLKAAERPDQSGSCVKYCRPAAAVWECAAFWIKVSRGSLSTHLPVH
ncbi:uncharacterized protein LOC135098203 isoform X2 [Scylla paramamosain]|uniref:uncharacterized protein LOC135098203 isoform X2 n=1 Tax=Scylla paramamosain TaxID=85552 RepID=UPI003083CEAE